MARRRRSLGRKRWVVLAVTLAAVLGTYFANLQPTAFTGRSQFVVISTERAAAFGRAAYEDILADGLEPDSGATAARIARIGSALAAAAAPEDPGYDWTFTLFQTADVNAFALPGGYTALYAGILPFAANEDGLAAIIGHEMAHVLARHGSERLSQKRLAQMAAIGLGLAASDLSPDLQLAALGAFGVGARYGVLLPYSRQHEREADYIGLILMARACFDPREAPRLWRRLADAAGETGRPEFLSTHPDPETRIENFERWMPEALAIRAENCGG